MNKLFRTVAVALTAYLVLSPFAPALAVAQEAGQQSRSALSASQLDAAVAATVATQEQNRERVTELLSRQQVRDIAASLGLDLTSAEAAVHTIDGEALQQAADYATQIDEALTGGVTIQMSLVAILLVVIIIILLAD